MKNKSKTKILVNTKNEVVSGPYTSHEAQQVRARYEQSEETLACLKAIMEWTNSEGFMPEGLEDRVNACIAKVEGRV